MQTSHMAWCMQGVHHKAEAEEGPRAGCCSSAYSECVAAASGQEERAAAHPQDAADKGRPLFAASGKFDQVRLSQEPTPPSPLSPLPPVPLAYIPICRSTDQHMLAVVSDLPGRDVAS